MSFSNALFNKTKTIKITSVIATILLLVGTYFKTLHWPGANVMLIIGAAAGVLLFVYFVYRIPSGTARHGQA